MLSVVEHRLSHRDGVLHSTQVAYRSNTVTHTEGNSKIINSINKITLKWNMSSYWSVFILGPWNVRQVPKTWIEFVVFQINSKFRHSTDISMCLSYQCTFMYCVSKQEFNFTALQFAKHLTLIARFLNKICWTIQNVNTETWIISQNHMV